jgi:hypothetical protein
VNVLDYPGNPDARARGDLAERMVPVACDLACLVRDQDREAVGRFLSRLTGPEIRALLVVMAGMMPVDSMSDADMLRWVRWDETGRPLDRPLAPCGTYAAFRRHKQRQELVDDECERAAREYWAERNRMRAKAAPKEGAGDAAA